MLVTTARITKTGLHNFIRNAWLSTAATAVMTVTLSLVAVSYIANQALNSTIQGVVEKIDVSVFFNDGAPQEQIDALKVQLEKTPNVKAVIPVSKEQALAEYRKANADSPKLLALVEESNPLPRSLQIKAEDPNKMTPITDLLASEQVKPLLAERDPISYTGDRKKTIDKIVQTSNFFKATGLVASVVFVIISTLIIFNTIRMAIFTRREEIEIMKLVGATNWFIRGPFIFEAVLYGVIAAVISLVFVYTVVLSGAPSLANYIDIDSIINFMKDNFLLVAIVELAIGIAIGGASSLFALKRYLKL